jgi:hypothetical protein
MLYFSVSADVIRCPIRVGRATVSDSSLKKDGLLWSMLPMSVMVFVAGIPGAARLDVFSIQNYLAV